MGWYRSGIDQFSHRTSGPTFVLGESALTQDRKAEAVFDTGAKTNEDRQAIVPPYFPQRWCTGRRALMTSARQVLPSWLPLERLLVRRRFRHDCILSVCPRRRTPLFCRTPLLQDSLEKDILETSMGWFPPHAFSLSAHLLQLLSRQWVPQPLPAKLTADYGNVLRFGTQAR